MALRITDKDIIEAPIVNKSGNAFLINNKLYYLFCRDFSERLNYLHALESHPNVLSFETVIPELESDYKSGYAIEYKSDLKTYMEAYSEHLSYEKKEKYNVQIMDALKHLHKNIVLGDINGDRFLIDSENACK